jgi:molybdenum cofactor cytidylyltransferase
MPNDALMAAVVPAAGRSERFGRMKLLAAVGGEPLLDRTLASLIDAGLSPVVVVTAPDAALGAATRLFHPAVRRVVNPEPSRGMFSSIRRGLEAVGSRPTLVLPADMPFVRAATVREMAAACMQTDRVVVPRYAGQRGHPVGIPARLIGALTAADPTLSLKEALGATGESPLLVEVDDRGVVRDVDTPDDLDIEN